MIVDSWYIISIYCKMKNLYYIIVVYCYIVVNIYIFIYGRFIYLFYYSCINIIYMDYLVID